MTTTPRTTSPPDVGNRQAEKDESKTVVSPQEFCRILDELDAADQPPVLPDTSGWVKRAPGDVIEAGTPYVFLSVDSSATVTRPDGAEGPIAVGPTDTYWTPPHVPREPWRVISTDRDQPTLAKVTFDSGQVVTREWWRSEICLNSEEIDSDPGEHDWIHLSRVTDVELLHTHDPVTHVPVERALIDEAARAKHVAEPWGPLYDVVNALAALAADGLHANSSDREAVAGWVDRFGDVWHLGDDGLMHSFETAPFPRGHVEKKWGPLRPQSEVSR